MKIQQLKCFLAVEKFKSFSQAADSLFMTQSALSKQIMSLETELGVQLFDRRTHTVRLTAAGDKIYSHAHWIVGEHEKLMDSLNFLVGIASKKISLSAPYDMSHFGIADMIIEFELIHPRTVAESHESDHEVMMYNLENRLTDVSIGFGEFWPHSEQYVSYPLLRDPLMLVMRSDHPLAGRESLALSEAAGEMFCLPREDTHFFRMFQSLCTRAGFSPNLTLSDVRISTIKRYILHGMRLTMATALRAESFFNEPDFAAVPLSDVEPLTLSLLTRNEQQNHVYEDFIEHAAGYYAKIAAQRSQ